MFGWDLTDISDNGVPETIPGTDGFIRHLDPRNLTFVRNYPGGKVGGGNIEDAKAHGGNYLVQVGADSGKKMSDRGLGFWSPALCTVPGAKVDVSLWMERSGIVPTDPERLGGAYVFVEWTSITGQNASRSYIVGGEKPGKTKQIELASGTGPYTNVKGSVTAPAGAVWMRLAFGMRLGQRMGELRRRGPADRAGPARRPVGRWRRAAGRHAIRLAERGPGRRGESRIG